MSNKKPHIKLVRFGFHPDGYAHYALFESRESAKELIGMIANGRTIRRITQLVKRKRQLEGRWVKP